VRSTASFSVSSFAKVSNISLSSNNMRPASDVTSIARQKTKSLFASIVTALCHPLLPLPKLPRSETLVRKKGKGRSIFLNFSARRVIAR
jgi:hypothetical protein